MLRFDLEVHCGGNSDQVKFAVSHRPSLHAVLYQAMDLTNNSETSARHSCCCRMLFCAAIAVGLQARAVQSTPV